MSHFDFHPVIYMKNSNKKRIFIESYDTYADAIFRYCSFRIYDRERAKEIMQETFTKTWEYMEKGQEIDNIKSFLYKVAHNLCVNEARYRKKSFSLDEMKENTNFDQEDEINKSPNDQAEISLLISRLNLLKEEERDLLVMRYVNDLAVSEIAKILQMLPNTVTVKIKRAEESLKKIYGRK